MIEAMGTRLIIKRVEQEKKQSAGGILLQYDHTESPRASIVSIGDKVEIKVAVGDRIIPDWNKVAHTKYESVDYFIIDQLDILGRYVN